MSTQRYKNMKEFYPFYLKEHSKSGTKALHFIGTTLAILFLILTIVTREPKFLLLGLFNGYLFAWIGHFVIEKNRPATFKYPILSFISDFRMYFELLTGKLPFSDKKNQEKSENKP